MKKKTASALSAVFGILLLSAVVTMVITVNLAVKSRSYSIVEYFSSFCLMITSLFGIYYILLGCSKEVGAKLYVWYMGAMVVCDLIAMYLLCSLPVAAVIMAVGIACGTVLCFAKDLGQKKSFIFALVGLVSKLICFAILIFKMKFFIINMTVEVLIGITVLFMVAAKYYDKAERKNQ